MPLPSTFFIGLSLRARVLLHAVMLSPLDVFRAGLWRVRGLKLRSRNTIASIAGRTPHAYRLWIHTREHHRAIERTGSDTVSQAVLIVPLILTDAATTDADLIGSCASFSRAGKVTYAFLFDPSGRFRPSPNLITTVKILHIAAPDELAAAVAALGTQWICPMLAGDELAQSSIDLYGSVLSTTPSNLAYGDDDLIASSLGRHDPHFKPDWNAELFKHQDYLSLACVVRYFADDLRLEARHDCPVAIARGLTRRALDRNIDAAPIHIPQILHHLKRRTLSLAAPAEAGNIWPNPLSKPRVSIIVPSKNKASLLRACIKGIDCTSYPFRELIIIDHESDEADARALLKLLVDRGDRVLPWSGPFNYSAMNNVAASLATGDYLCFLNNDIEMIDVDWLDHLVMQAIRPEVGAVGAKLLYPDCTIQHAGVVIGLGGGAGHAHRYLPNSDPGYFGRPHLPQFIGAVTAACMVVSHAKFDAVGGFDETEFTVAFNDVDLCLKLRAAGWVNFYEPRATLIHHESKSRGSDRLKKNRARFAAELAALKRKWRTDTEIDPYHNPNLSKLTEQFLIDIN